MKIVLGELSAKLKTEDILNRQLGMAVYIKIVMIMVLEQ
jgi:hypothetical protein